MAVYHVAKNGCDQHSGSAASPFLTIGRAAQAAAAGDTVIVHEGEYREWVDPRCGGLSDTCRITYEAAPGEHVVIKGSEIITGWERRERPVPASVPWPAVLRRSWRRPDSWPYPCP